MPNLNIVVLAGHLTRDIELRYTPSNVAVCDMGLAVTDRVKRGQEWTDETSFIDIVLFGRIAEVASEYLKKGSAALVSGRLKQDSWTDKESGQKRYKIKVIADKLQLLGGKGQQRDEYTQDAATHEGVDEPLSPQRFSTPAGDDISF